MIMTHTHTKSRSVGLKDRGVTNGRTDTTDCITFSETGSVIFGDLKFVFIKHWFCLSCYRGRLRVNDDDGQYPFDPSIFSPFRILDLPLAKMRPIDTDVAWSLSVCVCVCPSVCVSVLFVITTSDAKTAEQIEIGPY